MSSDSEVEQRDDSIRIAVYNHKGGVGKTTLTVNIAYALTELGKRVLLVDSDPQCNLTAYLVEGSVVDDLLDNSDGPRGQTIWSAVKPVVEAVGEARKIKPFERRTNLYLLPGDIRLSEFENELNQYWAECFQRRIRGFRGTSSLSSIVNQTAVEKDIDVIFYDVGPNVGPLNRAILLDCDFFIIPAACDLFSLRALKTLGATIANWIGLWKSICELAPDDVYLLPGRPGFLGYIPQRFRTYGGDQPSSTYAPFMSRIERHVNSDVVAVLRKNNPELAPDSLSQAKLGQVKDFGGLVSESQKQGVPMWEVSGGTQYLRTQARQTFVNIANKIVRRALSN